jgi:hypothetical protein
MPEFIVWFKFKADNTENLEAVLLGERNNWANNPWAGIPGQEAELVEIGTPKQLFWWGPTAHK